ncbi:hypothetical protein [Chryseobacterium sp. JV274]|uniref:hypothetical protein n=1 Tax=Chryseobacterium sp. JV274 TaxID=1932669 RepID=UPI0015C1D39D|nr:hypothetical protein [Chryseobacterium sp. JV274]CAD0220274.1 protein of unknown function [Chryseobacterium sp. JV274]
MKPNFKIFIKHIKVSKNTINSYLEIHLNKEAIAHAEVNGNKSISASGISIGDAWLTTIKSKKDIVDLFGEYWSASGLRAVNKKLYNPDLILYETFLEHKRISNMTIDDQYYYLYEDDDNYKEFVKSEAERFEEEYPELIYGPLRKRHSLVRKRKYYFLPKMVQVGTNDQVNEALKFWKEFK